MLSLYQPFWELLKLLNFDEKIRKILIDKTKSKLIDPVQGDYPRWLRAYQDLLDIAPSQVDVNSDAISCNADVSDAQRKEFKSCLQQLIPWRKGPFDLFDIFVDSEWQSHMKWNRIKDKIPELHNKRILDVGCGNGYYMFRMSKQNPLLLMGIDPGLLQIMQFWTVEKYLNSSAAVLPLTIQDLPHELNCFDVVFSMGVLYHRKSPIHHIRELADTLQSDGHLILETLVVDGDENCCFIPTGRYAQMRNVWFLPSVSMLQIMLQRCGFQVIKCIDITKTTVEEQRSTQWMKFHSLENFLNTHQNKTVEGYAPPKRATIVAQKK